MQTRCRCLQQDKKKTVTQRCPLPVPSNSSRPEHARPEAGRSRRSLHIIQVTLLGSSRTVAPTSSKPHPPSSVNGLPQVTHITSPLLTCTGAITVKPATEYKWAS